MELTLFFKIYIACYVSASALACAVLYRKRQSLVLFSRRYREFLSTPWKLVTFLIAAGGMIVIAPYTGDPTWDYVDAGFMSLLTYLTAPYAVGTLYRFLRRKAGIAEAYLSACLWMISTSWSYDLYILLKNGYYPPTWWSNIILSSILYFAAGMMWNLQFRPDRGAVFGFRQENWPNPEYDMGFAKIGWFALPLMVLVSAMILPFIF